MTFALAVLLAGSQAALAAYCAMYSDGSRACGIPSFEMCRQSVTGIGGSAVWLGDAFVLGRPRHPYVPFVRKQNLRLADELGIDPADLNATWFPK